MSHAKTPLISVLMPVYNVENYLAEAIESILEQSLDDFELIIIDDGSTDGSKDIVSEYAEKDSRITFLSRPNKGIVETRNELLNLAKGRYSAIMDGDDISCPNRLAEQYNFLTANDEYLIVGCSDLLIDPEGDPIMVINNLFEHAEIDEANLKREGFQTLNAYMAVTEAVKKVGAYRVNVTYAEDRDLFLRLAEVGKVKVLPMVLYKYRQHFVSTCVKKRQEIDMSVVQVINDALNRRGQEPGPVNTLSHQAQKDLVKKDYFLSWAWWALDAKNYTTAKKYALKLLASSPFSYQTWQLIYCVLRAHKRLFSFH